jgi:SAM-dependent methyltransferase
MTSVTAIDQGTDLEREYERRFASRRDYRWRVWTLLVHRVFQTYVPEAGSVLELGCGWGEFINQIRASRRYAMDLNAANGARLDAGIEFLAQDCSRPWPLPDESLDVVFTSNFFEHLPDKAALGATLREAHRCLKRGGRILCLGPNVRAVPGAYWDFWDHYLPLTERSLAEGLELNGFMIVESRARFLPYTMARDRNPPLWTVSLYLSLPPLWPILGRQFFVVGGKP